MERGRIMDPATTEAVVTAVISTAAAPRAAWVQGRAQQPGWPGDQQLARLGEPAPRPGTSVMACYEPGPDDRP